MAVSEATLGDPIRKPSFDVTCVIGTVELGQKGRPSHVAAFELIAEYDQEGVFTFPRWPDGLCRVTVEHEGMIDDA